MGMATIRQVQNDALCNLCSTRVRWICLFTVSQTTTSVIIAANLPSVFAKTNQSGLFFSQIFFSFLSLASDWEHHRSRLSVPPKLICHMCFLSAGRPWWDDNHVQHDPPGLQGGRRLGAHLWGFQQGHPLLQDPDDQTHRLLWVCLILATLVFLVVTTWLWKMRF